MTVRRDRRGNLVPELADFLAGKRAIDRLTELPVPKDRTIELGRSVHESTQPADPKDPELLAMIDQLKAKNASERRKLEQERSWYRARDTLGEPPQLPDQGKQHDQRQGGAEHQREQDRTPARKMTIEDFLAEARDDDDNWS